MRFQADVIGYDQESLFSPVIFQIRVSCGTGVHFVWHRYNTFKQLAAYLHHRYPTLPTLQGGHLWQKAVNSAGFLRARQRCLTSFLQAALSFDETVEDVILREFLGISESGPTEPDAPDAPDAVQRPRADSSEPSRGRTCSSLDKFVHQPSSRHQSCIGFIGPARPAATSCLEIKRCLSTPLSFPLPSLPAEEQLEEASRVLADQDRFSEAAVIIARDVSRVFPSNNKVQDVRLEIADVLRAYAREDPDLGYTQGMCFAAAVVCVGAGDLADKQQRFNKLMGRLRDLWVPGFPLVEQGIPAVEAMLASKDPELMHHLYHTIMMDIVPFLEREGLPGFVIVTFLMLLAHRSQLLAAQSLDEILPCINGFSKEEAPDQLLRVCQLSVLQLRNRSDSLSWVATMATA